tara:strand:+ start:701 stop:895 length:195 start_codon:yes stop_codon:yes gene_type:complete
MMMKIERFRTFEGIEIRAFDKKDENLFRHCAGASCVSSRQQKKVHEMLFIHGVTSIETIDSKSI